MIKICSIIIALLTFVYHLHSILKSNYISIFNLYYKVCHNRKHSNLKIKLNLSSRKWTKLSDIILKPDTYMMHQDIRCTGKHTGVPCTEAGLIRHTFLFTLVKILILVNKIRSKLSYALKNMALTLILYTSFSTVWNYKLYTYTSKQISDQKFLIRNKDAYSYTCATLMFFTRKNFHFSFH